MDPSRLLLAFAVGSLAVTQVPAAHVNMAILDCQQRFIAESEAQGGLVPAIAVKFCNGTSEGREAY